ncbi:MAG: GldG family protein [Chloroflexi bacterium]|nr:GldG family protein [Chloroflexota bacterium]
MAVSGPPSSGGGIWDRLRGWSLLLAALGGIGALGGLLLVVWAPELRPFAVPTLIAAGVLLALAAAGSAGYLIRAVSGRRGRLSWVTLGSATAALAIVIALNVIASATDASWDLTATRQFELSPQTEQALTAIPADVTVTGFIVTTDPDDLRYQGAAEGYLRQFARHIGGKLSYRFVDPELEPATAREFGVVSAPALLFTAPATGLRTSVGGRALSEQQLLTAVLTVTGVRQHAVYFLTGHGERSIADLRADGSGLGLAAAGLRADGYRVESLMLSDIGGVPADASLLVVAAPRQPPTNVEEQALIRWLADGGRALFMLDTSAATRDAMSGLLAAWGLETIPGALVDRERSAAGDTRTLAVQRDQYAGQTSVTEGGAIVEPLGPTLFPGAVGFRPLESVASSIERGDPVPVRFEPLVTTSRDSWAVEAAGDTPVDGRDVPGPHTPHLILQASALVSGGSSEPFDAASVRTTLAVLGDADFASNRHFHNLSNADFFLNTVNWLLEDAALISVRARQEVFRPLVLTIPEYNLVRYLSWFLLPALIAAAGVVVWWRRR